MASKRAPSARLRRFAVRMRKLRIEAKISQETAAAAAGVDPSSIWRIETAGSRPRRKVAQDLLTCYGITDPEAQAPIIALLKKPGDLGWLMPLSDDLPEDYQAFIEFESEASNFLEYGAILIPGLMQTPAYTGLVVRSMVREADDEYVTRRVEVRRHRQEVLTRDDNPLRLWAVLDEGAIRRTLGDPKTHREQLLHLLQLAERPNITIQVAALTASGHPGLLAPFTVMDFPEPDLPLVYSENSSGGLLVEDGAEVARHRTAFHVIAAQALGSTESLRMIRNVAEAL